MVQEQQSSFFTPLHSFVPLESTEIQAQHHASSSTDHHAESSLKSFIAGGVGGALEVLVGHPLDLIKVRMQMGQGTSVSAMLGHTFATEGATGLFRGVSAPLLVVTPLFAVSFWSYDMGQRLVQWSSRTPVGEKLSLGQKCIAGGLSGIPTTVLMTPSERIKVLMQVHPGRYQNMVACASSVYAQGGLASLYRGTVLTIMRDVPGSLAWFGTYESVKMGILKAQGMEDSSKLSASAVLTAGGLAGMACWTVSIPADVLKSRQQAAPEGTYNGPMDVFRTLMRKEGPMALFKGLRPALLRAFPANAACFLGMEMTRSRLGFLDDP